MKIDPRPLLAEYVRQLAEVATHGDAREESFYPPFATLIKQMAAAHGLTGIHVVQQPRPTEAGNPDFRVWDGRERIIGYIEAKAPDKELLDPVEDTEQLRRYIKTFPNLLLTNFLEFRLYRHGQRVQTALLGRPVVLHRLKAAPPVENIQQVCQLFEAFLGFSLPLVLSAKDLAAELAKRCSFLRDIVSQQLAEEKTAQATGRLTGFYDAFKQFLMGELAEDTFADLYAQTVTYGLFAARTRNANSFNRRTAFENIPHTVGVLRDLFR